MSNGFQILSTSSVAGTALSPSACPGHLGLIFPPTITVSLHTVNALRLRQGALDGLCNVRWKEHSGALSLFFHSSLKRINWPLEVGLPPVPKEASLGHIMARPSLHSVSECRSQKHTHSSPPARPDLSARSAEKKQDKSLCCKTIMHYALWVLCLDRAQRRLRGPAIP